MNAPRFDFDPPMRPKLSTPFQPASETSREAAERAQAFVGDQGARVLAWIQVRGSFGATQRECSEALGIGRPSICARVRALEQVGQIVKTDRKRDGCFVYVRP